MTPTNTQDRLSVRHPGGVIAHLQDGSSVTLKYGDTVPENLADYVDVSRFADTQSRENPQSQELEAHRRAALSENGQINSTSSAVPSNYSDLDEDTAARFIANLASRPAIQASVIKHEILFGGNRQKVLDAAADAVIAEAQLHIAALDSSAKKLGDVDLSEPVTGSLGDPDLRSPATNAKLLADTHKTPAPSAPADRGAGDPEDDSLARNLPDGSDAAQREAGANPGVPESENPEADRRNSDETVDGGEVAGWDDDSVWTKAKLHAYAEQHNIEVGSKDNRGTLVEKISAQHSSPETPPSD